VERFAITLVSSRTAPRAARMFLRESLATRELDGVGHLSELLTTELVTNVVLHVGCPTVELRLSADGDHLRVEVDDSSTRVPMVRRRDASRGSGVGMQLVEQLASRWGTEVRADGKTVWFEIDLYMSSGG
jgi:anti-sigma regulatory factor (Ser/Thr protein kinase)